MSSFLYKLLGIIILLVLAMPVAAQTRPAAKLPLLFSADEVIRDRDLGIIKAAGSVEISQGDRVLLADNVSYSQKDNIVTASGNISLLEPSGEVLFANFMELSGDLKDGIISGLRVRLSDNARIAAAGARRSAGNRTEMRNAVYSPCESCTVEPGGEPFWQLKARKVVHDQKEKIIEYSDAFLEIAGVPVAYTPYFSHPDPTVERKTGFLVPSAGGSTALGTTLTTPFFWNITPDRDITFIPTITSKEGLHLAGESRNLTATSRTDVKGSLTYDSNDDIRGHIDTVYRRDIDDTWRGGFDLKRASDDTYQRRYGITSPKTMTSRAFAEAFRGRDYLAMDSYLFQGLQENDSAGKTPIILPMVDFNHVSNPRRFGATTSFDVNALALTRTEGHDTKRLSMAGGWHLPRIGHFGEVMNFNVSLRGDMYHTTNFPIDGQDGTDSGITGRIHPEATVNWRFPVARTDGRITQTLEPVASVTISPNGGNPSSIPNEDSIDLELDDTNLLSSSRFIGLDRVEGGPRFSYGVKWAVTGRSGGNSSFFVGQSFRVRDDDTFGEGSGLEDNFSDIVSRVDISPGEFVDLSYRTRLDKDDLSPRRNEVSLVAGPPALRAKSDYVFFERQQDSEFGGREEISGSLEAKINKYWKSSFSGRYNLVNSGVLRNIAFNLTYECECFTFST
ncbi:MAG: LPS assembly protein LptD, partial [Rhodospirillales bacterium]|nr:LPS assembly protein LptD [Rhodospirillales bacterium]